MSIYNRLRAAFYAFKKPQTYWGGEAFEGATKDIGRGGRIAIVKYDPDMEWTIHPVGYPDSRSVCEFLGMTL